MITIDWQDLDHATFLRDYWQKQPLFLSGAVSGLSDLLDGNDLAGLSADADVESRIIYQHGNRSDGKYDLAQGPFTEDDYLNYGASHWTLLVQAVNHYLPELSGLLQAFRFIPNWLMDDIMVSYATPNGGVGAHFDQYDVFLIQASGTRDWHIGQYCDGTTALVEDSQVKLLKDFQLVQTFHCQPGDMLYLPPGLSHHGIATSEHCITYSVGARAPSYRYLIERLCDQLIEATEENDLYTSKALTEQPTGQFTPDVLLSELQHRVSSFLSSDTVKNELSIAMSEAKYYEYQPEADDELTQELLDFALLDPSYQLFRDEGSRLLYTDKPFAFYVNGHTVAVAESATPLVRYLCDNYVLSKADISHIAQTPEAKTLLLTLCQQGIVRVDTID